MLGPSCPKSDFGPAGESPTNAGDVGEGLGDAGDAGAKIWKAGRVPDDFFWALGPIFKALAQFRAPWAP